jgi:hypothetical protein
MEHFFTGILEPGKRNGDRVLAENSFVARRAVAVVSEFAILDGKFDPVTAGAVYGGANSIVALLQAGDDAIVEIGLARANVFASASD